MYWDVGHHATLGRESPFWTASPRLSKVNTGGEVRPIPVIPGIPGVSPDGQRDGPTDPTLDRARLLEERQEAALAEEVRNPLAQDASADVVEERR